MTMDLSQAALDVLAERKRQVVEEGWDADSDDSYVDGELASAALNYASPEAVKPIYKKQPPFRTVWPFALKWWRPRSYRRNLVKAAALLLAEIERLDRAASNKN
ncbi:MULTISPECIES: hypothetical protein [Aeromonas]|uniref:hypothetical protein n=1 Tax=Aeromonas TaxID=642 RepID=UPI002B05239D|nr:hypothetical protein [Aeromonas jandaei]